MKILVTGDWHLSNSHQFGTYNEKTGNNSRFDDQINATKQIIEYCKNNDIDKVVYTGDTFAESSGVADNKRRMIFANIIKDLSEACPSGVDIIVGNHDISGDSNIYFDIKTWCPNNVRIIDKPLYDKEINAVYMPYFNIKNIMGELKGKSKQEVNIAISDAVNGILGKIQKRADSICFFHFTVSEAKYKEGICAMFGHDIIIESFVLDKYFKRSIGGHLHLPQDVTDRIHYHGSLIKTQRNEGQNKSFIVYDTLKDTIDRVDISHRDIIDVSINNNEFDFIENTDDIYVVTVTSRDVNMDELRKALKRTHHYKIIIDIYDEKNFKNNAPPSSIVLKSDEEILSDYFNKLDKESLDKIIMLFNKIKNE